MNMSSLRATVMTVAIEVVCRSGDGDDVEYDTAGLDDGSL